MDEPVQPVHDPEVATLHRDLEDLRHRLEQWMTTAATLLASRSQQLVDLADGLDALARDARRHVHEVTLPDVPTAPDATVPSDADDLGLDALWNSMRPVALDRLRIVSDAGAAARAGTLTDDHRADAIEAARQLRGSLGGYGKLEGSAAAGRAADLLAAAAVPCDELDAAVQDLRRSIDPARQNALSR